MLKQDRDKARNEIEKLKGQLKQERDQAQSRINELERKNAEAKKDTNPVKPRDPVSVTQPPSIPVKFEIAPLPPPDDPTRTTLARVRRDKSGTLELLGLPIKVGESMLAVLQSDSTNELVVMTGDAKLGTFSRDDKAQDAWTFQWEKNKGIDDWELMQKALSMCALRIKVSESEVFYYILRQPETPLKLELAKQGEAPEKTFQTRLRFNTTPKEGAKESPFVFGSRANYTGERIIELTKQLNKFVHTGNPALELTLDGDLLQLTFTKNQVPEEVVRLKIDLNRRFDGHETQVATIQAEIKK